MQLSIIEQNKSHRKHQLPPPLAEAFAGVLKLKWYVQFRNSQAEQS